MFPFLLALWMIFTSNTTGIFQSIQKNKNIFFELRESLRTGVEKAANYRQVLSGISRPRVQRGEKRYLLSPPDHKALTVQARSRIRG